MTEEELFRAACVRHAERLATTEEAIAGSKLDRERIWSAVNAQSTVLHKIAADSGAVLQQVQQMAEEQRDTKRKLELLLEAKERAEGAERKSMAFIAAISAAASGFLTYALAHFFGVGSSLSK